MKINSKNKDYSITLLNHNWETTAWTCIEIHNYSSCSFCYDLVVQLKYPFLFTVIKQKSFKSIVNVHQTLGCEEFYCVAHAHRTFNNCFARTCAPHLILWWSHPHSHFLTTKKLSKRHQLERNYNFYYLIRGLWQMSMV